MPVRNMRFLNTKEIEMSQPLNVEACASEAKQQIIRRLRDKRNEFQITQERLAVGTGLKQTYITKLESGKSNPTLSNVLKIFCFLENEERKKGMTFCERLMVPWKDVKYAKEDEFVIEAIQRMLDGGFSQLPVHSKGYSGEGDPYPSELVGMITEESILRSGKVPNVTKVDEMMDGIPSIISIRETPDNIRNLLKGQQAVFVKGDRERIVGFMSRVDLMEGLRVRSDSSSWS